MHPQVQIFLISDALIVSNQKWKILHLYTTGLGWFVKAVSSREMSYSLNVNMHKEELENQKDKVSYEICCTCCMDFIQYPRIC